MRNHSSWAALYEWWSSSVSVRAVRVRDAALDRLAGRQLREADEADAIVLADLVVVGRVAERQRQQALLLQVGLVDAREAARDDGRAAEQARRQRGVLAADAFAVVVRRRR